MRNVVYIRGLTEPFSPAEAIEIETSKYLSSCAAKGEREMSVQNRVARERSLTLAAKHKR